MKGLKMFLIPIFGVVGFSVFIWAAELGDIETWTGMGARRDTVEFKVNEPTVGSAADFIPGTNNVNSLGTDDLAFDAIYTYDLIQKGDAYVGSNTAVAHSTTTGEGKIAWAYLAGTTNAVVGHLLVFANAALGTSQGVTVTVGNNTADLTTWAGICAVAASTGGVVGIYNRAGDWVLARTTGTVTEGQILVSGTSADGYLQADATPTTGADVGVALEDGTAAGGLTLIQLR